MQTQNKSQGLPNNFHKVFAILCALLLFSIVFLFTMTNDLDAIFYKYMFKADEAVNSTVSANLTRKFYPPMVRIKPLIKEQTWNWVEGPYWAHIPPLFAYVPWIFFKMGGGVTIEMKRFSYAFIMFITGLLFIVTVSLFDTSYLALLAATLASIIWVSLPFSKGLITGTEFGASDIVLAFSVICSFSALCWYLRCPRPQRLQYPMWSIAAIAFFVSLPILIKSVLGAIPCLTFFIFLLYDHKKLSSRFNWACSIFFIIILVYYGAIYFSTPQSFKLELISYFKHINENYENWGRPWYFYIGNYIPNRYFRSGLDLLYWSCILAGIYGLYLYRHTYSLRTRQVLWLSFGWFALLLVSISLIITKCPNFIYQTILLSIFFGCYSIFLLIRERRGIVIVFALLVFVLIYNGVFFVITAHKQCVSMNNYVSDDGPYYHFAEIEKSRGAGTNDIYVLNKLKGEYWFRFYIIFLTGAEARMFDELQYASTGSLKEYDKVCFVFEDNTYGSLKTRKSYKIHRADRYIVLEFDGKDVNSDLLSDMSNALKIKHT